MGVTTFAPLKGGRWLAVDEELVLSAHGGSKAEAERNLDHRRRGETPPNEKPHLKLCKPCNKRAAKLGEEHAAKHGVEVCQPCAKAIDQWVVEMKKWRLRQQRKARRKRRQKARRK